MSLYISFFLQSGVEILNGELTIHKVQQTDSGMYQCVGENKYGAIYSNAELKILGSHIAGVESIILKIDGTAKENKQFSFHQKDFEIHCKKEQIYILNKSIWTSRQMIDEGNWNAGGEHGDVLIANQWPLI